MWWLKWASQGKTDLGLSPGFSIYKLTLDKSLRLSELHLFVKFLKCTKMLLSQYQYHSPKYQLLLSG